jgi:hypothetical protein
VYGDEVKNVNGELRGKNASSAQVRFVRILFIPFFFRNYAFVVSNHISGRELKVFKIL